MCMLFGLLTLITAIAIAGVAAWFSIAGLMIFFGGMPLLHSPERLIDLKPMHSGTPQRQPQQGFSSALGLVKLFCNAP